MRDPLDRYYTPFALARACVGAWWQHAQVSHAFEPSLGGGAFVEALQAHGVTVAGCDVDPDALGLRAVQSSTIGDFLRVSPGHCSRLLGASVPAVVGNPPYAEAEAHVRHALEVTDRHVLFLLRASFLGSRRRIRGLWRDHPPRRVWWICPRPSFTGDGKTDGAEYALFWWDTEHKGEPVIDWLRWSGVTDEREHLERMGQSVLFGGGDE